MENETCINCKKFKAMGKSNHGKNWGYCLSSAMKHIMLYCAECLFKPSRFKRKEE